VDSQLNRPGVPYTKIIRKESKDLFVQRGSVTVTAAGREVLLLMGQGLIRCHLRWSRSL
jgi:hypothetical protein